MRHGIPIGGGFRISCRIVRPDDLFLSFNIFPQKTALFSLNLFLSSERKFKLLFHPRTRSLQQQFKKVAFPVSFCKETLGVGRIHSYRLPTKLREGNVFSHVCLSVILFSWTSHMIITHDVLELNTQGPLDMFKLGPHCTGTPSPSHHVKVGPPSPSLDP